MRILPGLVLTSLLSASNAQAALITLNFDELSAGTVLDTEYAALGVTFSNSAGLLRVDAVTPGVPFTAPNAVTPVNPFVAGFNQATFSVPVSSVSVVIGDFNGDADNLFLHVFDSADNLIASDTDFLAAPVNGGILLSASAPNIAYARFFGVGGTNNDNSVYFDNFSFEPVPEPAALVLFGTALVFGTRRYRVRNSR